MKRTYVPRQPAINRRIAGFKGMDYQNEFVNKKQLIRDIIDNVIIKERSEVEVWAHIPLTSFNTLKLGHEPIGWNSRASKCWKVDVI